MPDINIPGRNPDGSRKPEIPSDALDAEGVIDFLGTYADQMMIACQRLIERLPESVIGMMMANTVVFTKEVAVKFEKKGYIDLSALKAIIAQRQETINTINETIEIPNQDILKKSADAIQLLIESVSEKCFKVALGNMKKRKPDGRYEGK